MHLIWGEHIIWIIRHERDHSFRRIGHARSEGHRRDGNKGDGGLGVLLHLMTHPEGGQGCPFTTVFLS